MELNAICNGIELSILHRVLHPQRRLALVNLPLSHVLKKLERFADGSLPKRRRNILLHLSLRLVANVRVSVHGETYSEIVQFLKVVRRVRDLVGLVAEPIDHLADADKKPLLLLSGVRVVVAEVAIASVYLGIHKVEVHGLCVSDMKDAVGLRGKSRVHLSLDNLDVAPQQLHCLVRHNVPLRLEVLANLVKVKHGTRESLLLSIPSLCRCGGLGRGCCLLCRFGLLVVLLSLPLCGGVVLGSPRTEDCGDLRVEFILHSLAIGPPKLNLQRRQKCADELIALFLKLGLPRLDEGSNGTLDIVSSDLHTNSTMLIKLSIERFYRGMALDVVQSRRELGITLDLPGSDVGCECLLGGLLCGSRESRCNAVEQQSLWLVHSACRRGQIHKRLQRRCKLLIARRLLRLLLVDADAHKEPLEVVVCSHFVRFLW
eukprot:Opistho-2@70533